MRLTYRGENFRWILFTTLKFKAAGRPVARWRRIVRVSRGSWSLSWQKYTTRPPISVWRRRAVRILATRKRRGKKPQGCWPNAIIGSGVILRDPRRRDLAAAGPSAVPG